MKHHVSICLLYSSFKISSKTFHYLKLKKYICLVLKITLIYISCIIYLDIIVCWITISESLGVMLLLISEHHYGCKNVQWLIRGYSIPIYVGGWETGNYAVTELCQVHLSS